MSSCPGRTLEDFVEDALWHPTPREVAAVVAVLEPHREGIEASLDAYEEDEHSWRDYRNSLWWTYVSDEPAVEAAVKAALASCEPS